MSLLYNFPSNTSFGRVLPKSKIYEHATPGSKVKELFVREVEKITWSYKLSPETINLPAKGGVQEIQVFTILLKTGKLSHEVLKTIDKAIPSPILFVVRFGKQVRYVAAYKRQSEADKSKWVVSSYFETGWMNEEAKLIELPVVLDLGGLYRAILKNIIQLPAREEEPIDVLVTRVDRLQILEWQVAKVQTLLNQEKQFNRKVKINAEMRSLKQEIEALTR